MGGLLTSTENLENFGNSWGGQGPNWGGTDFPKFFWEGPSLVILGVLPRYEVKSHEYFEKISYTSLIEGFCQLKNSLN